MGATQANITSKGHVVQEAEPVIMGEGIAGETLAAGDVVYLKAADSKLWKFDGTTEDMAAAIVGVIGTGGDATDPVTYFMDNGTCAGASLTVGDELWAKHDATLVNWAGLTAAKWTKKMGIATTTSAAQLSMGEVQQKPA